MDDRTISFLKSSVSLNQEIKCDKIIDFIRILYTVHIGLYNRSGEQRRQFLRYKNGVYTKI